MRDLLQRPLKRTFHRRDKKGRVTITFEVRAPTKGRDWVTLSETESPTVSFVGDVYDEYGYASGGQVNESIDPKEYEKPVALRRILKMWKAWHLNDMQAGTQKQTRLLEQLHSDGSRYDFQKDCEYLRKMKAYADRSYEYGTAWLLKLIPKTTIEEITALMKGDV